MAKQITSHNNLQARFEWKTKRILHNTHYSDDEIGFVKTYCSNKKLG